MAAIVVSSVVCRAALKDEAGLRYRYHSAGKPQAGATVFMRNKNS